MTDCINCFDQDTKSIENSRFIFQNSVNSMFQNQVIVDIATLEQDINTISVNDSQVITLKTIDIYYDTFRDIFYYNNDRFQLVPSYRKQLEKTTDISLVTNDEQSIIDRNGRTTPYKIYAEMLAHYERFLGLKSNCWSSCSLNNFQKVLGDQYTLYDVGNPCNVKCSLTLDEYFYALEQQGVNMTTGDNLNDVVPAALITCYKPIAVVTTTFKSLTEGVPNVDVVWPFAVDFQGVRSRYNPGYFFQTRTELDNAIDLYISNKKEGKNIFGEIDKWNITAVTDLSELFKDKNTFNENIGNWDTRRVTTMQAMFEKSNSFNQDISRWNTSNVISMKKLFAGASAFNQDISSWDISNVTTMNGMFASASTFNQNLNNWDVTGIDTDNMFYDANSMDIANYPNGYSS